jgi:putative transposase
LVQVSEGMALHTPRPSIAAMHRRVTALATQHPWTPPSYGSVYGMVRQVRPAMGTLAQDGPAAFRDRYDLISRHRAAGPHALWQAAHPLLDVLVLAVNGAAVRPWLTLLMDDYARAVAGSPIFLEAPTTLPTALALRQAMWRKQQAAWPVCGSPDVLYVEPGRDFTSRHLEQAAADLHFHLVFASVGRPQGRGTVARLFGTLHTACLAILPGSLRQGHPTTPPRLSLAALDTTMGAYFLRIYTNRLPQETGLAPLKAWLGHGWLPRLPHSLAELDRLLVKVAPSRLVRRDGVHLQGLRSMAPTLAASGGASVTIRYDPRDLAAMRGLHRTPFLCRAMNAAHAGRTRTLTDLQPARVRQRRALRTAMYARMARVADLLPEQAQRHPPKTAAATHRRAAPKLSTDCEAKPCRPGWGASGPVLSS